MHITVLRNLIKTIV